MAHYRKLGTPALAAFEPVLGDRLESVPVSLPALLRGLSRRLGPLGALRLCLRALRNGAAPPDIRALVAGNLTRKQIRLPALFGLRPVAATYLHLKGAEAALLRDLLRLDTQAGRIDIIFNGSVYPESVLAAVADPSARVLVEAGFLPRTLQIDPTGLNGANSVPRDPAFYLDSDTDFAAAGLPETIGRRAAKSQHAPVTLPPDFVFVPFQVPSDMQITLHSPWLRDMGHFLAVLRDTADRNPHQTFVVKEHPSFRASVIGLFPPHPRILFANGNETASLIAAARAVLTINSTVGIEALQAAKPVITLGTACYAIAGLTLQAHDPATLDAALARHDWRPDERLRRQFLGFLKNVYLVPGTLAQPPADLAQAIAARLTGALSAWHIPGDENPRRRHG
ncbi:nitrogen fixation protein FixF [Paragemmobacter straminiformis]|uniref:Nitrogen fixation protein FixF n=1 Tax=Paragemmobacter straminiformis TaxID=2045119 RepID=A0A842I751_9RHOB|nr:nitrogen fixation protein FixF [Gemmobacter straminiformis]MBC2834808.1 nitrogen fixation protein FixF [Gemmobacter straminiformis]